MSRRLTVTWVALLAAAQVSDLATTWLGTRFGVPEENPLVAGVLAHSSFLGFGLVKALLVIALAVLLAVTGARHQDAVARAAWRSTQALTLVFTGIAAANTAGVLARFG